MVEIVKEETKSGEGTWAVSAVPRVPAVPTEMSSPPPPCCCSPVMASVLSNKMLSVTPALSSMEPSPTATAGNAMANDMLQMKNISVKTVIGRPGKNKQNKKTCGGSTPPRGRRHLTPTGCGKNIAR